MSSNSDSDSELSEEGSTLSLTSSERSDSSDSSPGTSVHAPPHESCEAMLASQLVTAAHKVKRLAKVKCIMEQSPFFDDDDVRRVATEMEAVERTAAAVRDAITKAQWSCVRMFITLQHRELEMEAAVTQGLLDPTEDTELFQGLVKKQVYLTRLATDAIEHGVPE